VKFDTFRRLYCWLLTLPNRILNLCRGQKTRGEKWIPCLAESQGRILYVRNMINRAIKHTSGGGKWRTRAHLVAHSRWRMASRHHRVSRFAHHLSAAERRKKFKVHSFLRSHYLLAIVDHSPTISLTDASRKSPFWVSFPFSFFFAFFFYHRNRSNISHDRAQRGFIPRIERLVCS